MTPTCRYLLLALVALVPFFGACRVAPLPAGRALSGRPIPVPVREARRRLRAYDTDGALALLEPARPLSAAEPERTWLLAHVWRERSEGERARAAAEALPSSPFGAALSASLAEDPERGLEVVRTALRRGDDPWVRLAAAYLHLFVGDGAAARTHAARARGRGIAFIDVEALLVEGRSLLEDGRLADASRAAAAAAAVEPSDVRAWFVAAEAARRDGSFERAVQLILRAMSQEPRAEGPARNLAELLRQERDGELHAIARRALANASAVNNPEREALVGLLAEERGERNLAIAHYDKALAEGANPIPVEADLRRLLAARGADGEWTRVVHLLERALPANVRAGADNLRAGAWTELAAAVRAAPDRRAAPAARRRLALALQALGAVREARSVLDGLTDAAALDQARRLDAYLLLLTRLQAMLEGGYRVGDRKERVEGLEAVAAQFAAEACRIVPADEAHYFAEPLRGARRVPFVGAWIDHSTDTQAPLVRYFRRYGAYLVFGQRDGQPVEAVLLSLGSLTRKQTLTTRGHTYRQDVAIGYDRRLRSFHTALGGDLGGACLPDGIWMDTDATRSVEHGLRRGLVRDAGAVRRWQRAPRLIPADTIDGPFALGDTGGAGARLALRYIQRRRDDPWGSLWTLVAHETGHLVELRRHLPLGPGLPATAALFAGSGFSPPVAEMELERRAQLAAVAESPDPDLALAEMLVMMPVVAREPSPHEGGYRMALDAFVRHVYAHPERYPAIDRRYRVLPQLDRLTNKEIRRAARAVLPR